jgi:hypothetical protein
MTSKKYPRYYFCKHPYDDSDLIAKDRGDYIGRYCPFCGYILYWTFKPDTVFYEKRLGATDGKYKMSIQYWLEKTECLPEED